MLADPKPPEIPAVSLQDVSLSFLKVSSQVRQFLVTQYPADIEENSVTAPEEVASTEVLDGILDNKVYWDLTSLTGGLDLRIRSSTRRNYGCLVEACSVFSEPAALMVAKYYHWQYLECR